MFNTKLINQGIALLGGIVFSLTLGVKSIEAEPSQEGSEEAEANKEYKTWKERRNDFCKVPAAKASPVCSFNETPVADVGFSALKSGMVFGFLYLLANQPPQPHSFNNDVLIATAYVGANSFVEGGQQTQTGLSSYYQSSIYTPPNIQNNALGFLGLRYLQYRQEKAKLQQHQGRVSQMLWNYAGTVGLDALVAYGISKYYGSDKSGQSYRSQPVAQLGFDPYTGKPVYRLGVRLSLD